MYRRSREKTDREAFISSAVILSFKYHHSLYSDLSYEEKVQLMYCHSADNGTSFDLFVE